MATHRICRNVVDMPVSHDLQASESPTDGVEEWPPKIILDIGDGCRLGRDELVVMTNLITT